MRARRRTLGRAARRRRQRRAAARRVAASSPAAACCSTSWATSTTRPARGVVAATGSSSTSIPGSARRGSTLGWRRCSPATTPTPPSGLNVGPTGLRRSRSRASTGSPTLPPVDLSIAGRHAEAAGRWRGSRPSRRGGVRSPPSRWMASCTDCASTSARATPTLPPACRRAAGDGARHRPDRRAPIGGALRRRRVDAARPGGRWRDVDAYRQYVQASLAEFAHRQAGVRLAAHRLVQRPLGRATWRAGRPVVVSDTGLVARIFRSAKDSLRASTARRGGRRHRRGRRRSRPSRQGRPRLAEEHFDGREWSRPAAGAGRMSLVGRQVRRLNWGCGTHPQPGWINSDLKDDAGIDISLRHPRRAAARRRQPRLRRLRPRPAT